MEKIPNLTVLLQSMYDRFQNGKVAHANNILLSVAAACRCASMPYFAKAHIYCWALLFHIKVREWYKIDFVDSTIELF